MKEPPGLPELRMFQPLWQESVLKQKAGIKFFIPADFLKG
jgi:hypothetical protein